VRRESRRLTYANVTSTLALVVALSGGVAFASGQLAPKSVGATQLRPGAVTADKIRKNAVTAPKIMALAVKEGKIAGAAVTSSKLGAGSVTSEKLVSGAVGTVAIADNSVTGQKVDESTLGKVPFAARADFASEAESANPTAFAKVSQEGVVDTSLSKGVGPGDVTLGPEPGIYCVNVPGFSPRGAQVTLEYNGSGGVTAYVKVGGAPECAAPRVQIQTYSGGTRAKEPFYIALYR
jgi:hypothetical protein